tara:strand:+ start:5257 stop:5571 length:315 start_codon:yes stop_codon:yes gene_type:complete
MNNNKTIKLYENLIRNVTECNKYSPFPIFDTEYVALIKLNLKLMKKDNNPYDELPVVACKHCKDLNIQCDEDENDICMRCGSVNEIVIYKDINDYLSVKDNEDN